MREVSRGRSGLRRPRELMFRPARNTLPAIMKILLLSIVACLVSCAHAPEPRATTAEVPAKASDEDPVLALLSSLVGSWKADIEAQMAPGVAPEKGEATAESRMIGKHWFVSAGRTKAPGMDMDTQLGVSYDPTTKACVGHWIDATGPRQWIYEGAFEPATKTFRLLSTGPSFVDPAKTDRYEDSIEILSPNRYVLRSAILNADGTRTLFMTADHRRTTR